VNNQKIAFLIPSLEAGGAERVVATLSNSICANFDVTIIVLYKSEIFYELNKNINIIFCTDIYKPIHNVFKSILIHLKFIRKNYSIIRTNDIKVLIGFMTTPNIYAILVSKLANISCLISERVHPNFTQASKIWFLFRKLIYPYTDYLIVQTKEIAHYFSDFINEEKIKIILNPLNPSLIKKINNKTERENIILNVGRLDYQKNQDLLIKAFANISNKNWKLILVGDGNKKHSYLALINELKINDSVELVGNIEDVSLYYNKSKIFAFSSRYEGFPNALTEALAFGLACISTDCPSGPTDLINNGENGFLIPVENQSELEMKLQLLMNDDKLRSDFSEKAKLGTEIFESDFVAKQWQELLQKLL